MKESTGNTIVLQVDDDSFEGEYRKLNDVQYAEHVTRSLDSATGVAVHYTNGETEFFINASLVGVYPQNQFDPTSHHFTQLVTDE